MFDRGVPVRLSFKVRPGVPETRVVSRTHQSFKKDANINAIMAKYQKTGILVEPGRVRSYRQAQFGDFSDLIDLPSTLDRIRKADTYFLSLPASTRERFGNDVSVLLDFVRDPANLEEAINLKLLPEVLRPKPKPSVPPVSTPKAAKVPPAGVVDTPPPPDDGGE